MYLEVLSMFEKKPNYSTNIKELIIKYSDRKNAEMFFFHLNGLMVLFAPNAVVIKQTI